MAAFQRGDAAAFSTLVERHEKPLWNFLRRFVGNPTVAEDLMQEVLLRVLRNAGDWQPAAKFTTWLYAIARNLCIDHARRMVHRNASSLDGSVGSNGDGQSVRRIDLVPGPDRGGEARVVDKETAALIEAAMQRLPDEQREVFLMREVMEMPFAEIAEAVGVSLPTVKSRMRYALERLREALQDLHEPARPAESAGVVHPLEVP